MEKIPKVTSLGFSLIQKASLYHPRKILHWIWHVCFIHQYFQPGKFCKGKLLPKRTTTTMKGG
jgi:hypothetical protein